MVVLVPIAGALAIAGILALAVVVWTTGRSRPLPRILAVLLLMEALFLLYVPLLVFGETPPPALDAVASLSFLVPVAALPWLYLGFVTHLDTPLVQSLRRHRRLLARVALGVTGSVLAGSVVALASGVTLPLWVPMPFLFLYAATLVFGLVASVSAWRRAQPATPARERAKAFALAFGTRDAFFLLAIAAVVVLNVTGASIYGIDSFWGPPLIGAVGGTAYAALLAHGILRTQLLDLDLRIRWGLSRATVTAAFVAVYLLVSEAARLVVEPTLGPWLGMAAAALLIFAIAPLQAAAERFALAVVPPAPLDARRVEIFQTALHDALAHRAQLGAKDRAFLDALARDLGLDARDVALLEQAARPQVLHGDPVAQLAAAGRFRPIREIGRGASGRAILARDATLDRNVVLKILRGGDVDAMLREARALARLRHPHVLAIHDAGSVDGAAYLVVEHAPGGSLADRLRHGPLAPAEFTRIANGVLDALGAVHGAGLLHRDVKPSNVLLDGETPKLGDFGIAHVPGFERTLGVPEVGTLRYLAPEQVRGAPASRASDIYAAAATLFEAVAGRPFVDTAPGESALDVRDRIRAGPPYPARGCGVPALDLWLQRALLSAPEQRYESAEAMRAALPLQAA